MSDETGMEITIKFSTEEDFKEFWDRYESNATARRVLSDLWGEMRSVIKYGEPVERDQYWYARYWELCKEYDIDGWGI